MSEPLKFATIFKMAKGIKLSQDETKQITKLLSTGKSTCFIAKQFKRNHRTTKKFIEKGGIIQKLQNLNQMLFLLHKFINEICTD